MAWSIATEWLKSGARSRPPAEFRLAAELRETAQSWRVKLAETAAGGQSPAARLAPSLEQLDMDLSRKPRVAILGEFNAGKTTLASVLARTSGLEIGLLANTRVATLLHHAEQPNEHILMPERRRENGQTFAVTRAGKPPFEYELLASRADLLNHCTILDTPGLSDPTHAEQVADLYARIADIAIWCSIAGHCWRESERQAWDGFSGRLRRYGILVLTGADAVPKIADRDRIRQRLERDAAGRFGKIVFLSARDAAAAFDPDSGQILDPALWQSSGAAELDHILKTLVAHVSAQRALRSRRWAARLLRRMAAMPMTEFAPSWWLPSVMKWSQDIRRISISLRGHHVTREQAVAEVESALARLREELASKLERLGRFDDVVRIDGAVVDCHARLAGVRQATTQVAVADAISSIGTQIFNDVSRLMRGAEKETATIAALESRLLDMIGSQRKGKQPTTRR